MTTKKSFLNKDGVAITLDDVLPDNAKSYCTTEIEYENKYSIRDLIDIMGDGSMETIAMDLSNFLQQEILELQRPTEKLGTSLKTISVNVYRSHSDKYKPVNVLISVTGDSFTNCAFAINYIEHILNIGFAKSLARQDIATVAQHASAMVDALMYKDRYEMEPATCFEMSECAACANECMETGDDPIPETLRTKADYLNNLPVISRKDVEGIDMGFGIRFEFKNDKTKSIRVRCNGNSKNIPIYQDGKADIIKAYTRAVEVRDLFLEQ